jgi:methyl-accepting chemotaxis protein
MLDELVEQADTVAAEVEQIAAANEQQADRIEEVSEAVGRLTSD